MVTGNYDSLGDEEYWIGIDEGMRNSIQVPTTEQDLSFLGVLDDLNSMCQLSDEQREEKDTIRSIQHRIDYTPIGTPNVIAEPYTGYGNFRNRMEECTAHLSENVRTLTADNIAVSFLFQNPRHMASFVTDEFLDIAEEYGILSPDTSSENAPLRLKSVNGDDVQNVLGGKMDPVDDYIDVKRLAEHLTVFYARTKEELEESYASFYLGKGIEERSRANVFVDEDSPLFDDIGY